MITTIPRPRPRSPHRHRGRACAHIIITSYTPFPSCTFHRRKFAIVHRPFDAVGQPGVWFSWQQGEL